MNSILITDLHIGKEGEFTHGVDVRKNFLDILEHIKAENPDRIVVAGDLCFDVGKPAVYHWIKAQLDSLAIPYDVIVGNHDDGAQMADIFQLKDDLKDGLLYYKKQLDKWDAIFLDTSTRHLSGYQLDWLALQLESKRPIIIFMHHPPIESEVYFMDNNHGLTNMKEVQKILMKAPRVVPIFTGHYHTEKTVCKENMLLQITPSCFFQIAQDAPDFQVDHYQIAYRKIALRKDNWTSTVRYVEGNSLSVSN